MSTNDGAAIIAVYAYGRLSDVLYHEHDGGLRYMRRLLKSAIGYSKAQYVDGDIVKILEIEPEMSRILPGRSITTEQGAVVRHAYYLIYDWAQGRDGKSYELRYREVIPKQGGHALCIPDLASAIPEDARILT